MKVVSCTGTSEKLQCKMHKKTDNKVVKLTK